MVRMIHDNIHPVKKKMKVVLGLVSRVISRYVRREDCRVDDRGLSAADTPAILLAHYPKEDNMSKKPDLETWMKQKTIEKSHGKARCYEWPSKVVEEIKFVLECNDKGTHKITLRDMVDRIREVHGIEATIGDLRLFSTAVLNRKSWSQA